MHQVVQSVSGSLSELQILRCCEGKAGLLPVQVFNSHCAPEPIANMRPEQLTITELKVLLKELKLPLTGRKVSDLPSACPALQPPCTLTNARSHILSVLAARVDWCLLFACAAPRAVKTHLCLYRCSLAR